MYKLLTAHGFFNTSRAFIGAVLVIYLINHSISLDTIILAKALQLAVSVLFNYHAGVIADKFGKKVSIILSCIFAILYFLSMTNPTNISVIVGEMLNGLSIAFYMGAYEAWTFEFKNKKENSFSLISRSSEILFLSSILASIIGALYFYNALYLSISFMIIAIILFYRTPQKHKKTEITKISLIQTINIFSKKINAKLAFTILFIGSMQLIYQYWSVFFSENLNVDKKNLGYILAIMMISQYLVSFLSRKIKLSEFKYANIISLLSVFLFSLLTILTFKTTSNIYIILALFILFSSSSSILYNLYFSWGCSIFSNSKIESSLISLLDTSSRLIGALLLWMFSSIKTENIYLTWLFFPTLILAFLLYSKGKL